MHSKNKIHIIDKMLIVVAAIVCILCVTIIAMLASNEMVGTSGSKLNHAISETQEYTWDISENGDGSVTAAFQEETGTLSISGTGTIKSYSGSYTYVPWFTYQSKIKKVKIEEGVTSICEYAFYENENITSINIPDSVTSIGDKAFAYCNNLRNVKLGSGLKTIGYQVFDSCKRLQNIELPEGLELIDRGAFANCYNLTSIYIPNSVKLIGQEDNPMYGDYQMDVFRGCINLENISVGANNTIYSSEDGVLFNKDKTALICYPQGKQTAEYTVPSAVTKICSYSMYNAVNITKLNILDGVTEIRGGATRGCSKLTDILIPETVVTLGGDLFDECRNLKNIIVDNDNGYYSSIDGVLFNKNQTEILAYPIGKDSTEYTIPNTVETIGSGAFRECENLVNINIPSSVTHIDWYAFAQCTNLVEIVIPDSVKTMGTEIFEMYFGYIFQDCENLRTIKLPSQMEDFYTDYAFQNCRRLEKIIIPEGTTRIGTGMFDGCSSLKSIELPESITSIRPNAFQRCSSLTEIPKGLPSLASSLFLETGLSNIEIPEGITNIPSDAFEKCRNITQINIPNTVTSIAGSAFNSSVLTIKVETGENEECEIELPEIIKRTMDSNDILYSESGYYFQYCKLSDDNTKIIASKKLLEEGKVYLQIKSGGLKDLRVDFQSSTYSDTVSPAISQIQTSYSGIYYPGDEIFIDIYWKEYVKGIPPKVKIKFGNGEEKYATVASNTWSNTPSIKYRYIIENGDNGLLEIISIEAENLTDCAGNKVLTDDIPKINEIMAFSMKIEEDIIKDEYHVTNKEELINIQKIINSGTFDFLDATIYLENDIELGAYYDETSNSWVGEEWIPIGMECNPFKGTFDGNAHTITGLYINSEENYQGFIGYNSGTIKNLGIKNGYIYSTGDYIGGISGINYGEATVENCYNGADIYGYNRVGGISGYNNNGSSGGISIIKSYNSGDITATGSCGAGILGRSWKNNLIEECYNSGNVSAKSYAGGIIGEMPGDAKYPSKVSNCYNIGTIKSPSYTGGIIGRMYFGDNDIIQHCYNIGNIEGNRYNYTGSIIGYHSDGIVENCYYLNTSTIKAIDNKDDETNNVYGLNEEYMKSLDFVTLLNSNNEEIVWKQTDGTFEYPVLEWQTTIPDYNDGNGDVEENVLTAITVTTPPSNTVYIEGQNFDPTGMVVTASYNDGTTKEVTNYTITDGNNLTTGTTSVTISYTENGITKTTTQAITVTEKLEIDLGTYEEKQEETGKYITKIAPETTIEEFIENIGTNGTIEIYKGTEKITDTETNIGTGMTVRISFNNQEEEYTVVVKGDINGDGNAKLSDLSKVKLAIVGTTQLEGAYKEAADINGDGNVKLSDLSKMKLYLVGTGSL